MTLKTAVQERMDADWGRDGDTETRRRGDAERPRHGEVSASPRLPLSASPRLRVSASLWLLLTLLLAGSSFADEFDSLRLKWRDTLTLGTNATKADTNYFAWISMVESNAQSYWTSMNTNVSRTNLWNTYKELGSDSSDITGTYGRLKAMALGYTVHGSALETNLSLRGAIFNGLDWMYTNYYNERITNEYDNWFDWEIATPLNLNDITVLLYNDLSGAQRTNYMNAVDHFTPIPTTIITNSRPATGANEVWKASIVAVRGAIVKNSAKIISATNALSDVFPYASTGDGFYPDGSFVFHSDVPYNGGYGAQLLGTIGPLIQLLAGSTWQLTDPLQTNVFRWVYDSFQPFIYRGALMQMVSGRYYTRDGDDHADAQDLMAAILGLAQSAPPADKAAYKSLIKYWIQADTYRSFIAVQAPPYNVWAKQILNDPTVIPAGEMVRHSQFPQMDRVVHLRPGWGFGLAMSSSRIGNYESINSENLHGWSTGDGMGYLYNGDLGQFADNFWSTVSSNSLPGTTVDIRPRAPSSDEGYLSPNAWVGGASLQNLYGLAGMQVNAPSSSLSAMKSWFMFDNEVVCLGAGITSSDNRPIQSIIENRRLAAYGDNPFTVNGTAKLALVGWSETMANTSWAHLEGNVPGAGIGYFFPQAATVKALREARSGAFSDLNTPNGATNLSTRNYLALWFDHGVNPTNATYSYVLLPNQTAAQVAGYAANPDVTVLGNSTTAQGVKESTLGITAINFWKDGTNRLSGITVDRKASVITRNDGSFLDVGISDPTQTNAGIINLEITNLMTMSALSWDAGITVVQTNPAIKLAVNVVGSGGKTFHARFFVGPVQTLTLSPVADAYVQNGTNALDNFGATSSLVIKTNTGTTNLTREAYLRFQLPPAPGIIFNATLRLVPVTPYAQTSLTQAVALVTNNSWPELGITWNNRPTSGPQLTNWAVPLTNAPVLLPMTAQAQQAAAGDGKLSFRIYSVGNNTTFTAYGSREAAANSQPQLILNVGRIPPTISLTNPTDGSVFDAPATITLAADAQDSDGTVTNVDFYSSTTKIGQSATAPYNLTVFNLGPGEYTFTAIVSDVTGLMSTSAPVTVFVYNPEPVGSGTGLWAEYYKNPDLTGLQVTRMETNLNFSWGLGSPDGAIPTDHFSARWTGKLQTRHGGVHLFHTVSDDGVRLWINDQLVIDNWTIHTATEDIGAISLLPGQYYDIVMEYFDDTGPAQAQLYWTQPGGTKTIIPQAQLYPADNGLRGAYYPGTNIATGTLAFTRLDNVINFSWGNSSPDPTLLPGAFSVQWKGKVRANQTGVYTFFTLSEDGVKLTVNNQVLISNWTVHAATENSSNMTLAAGQFYNITLDFFNATTNATVALMWAPPGESKQIIPETNLTPHQDNNPPVLSAIPNTATTTNRLLSFTASATDADAPPQSLTFSLDPGAPAGASINPITGLFTWTPPPTQALGSYSVTVRVTDNGIPVMTDAQTLTIAVTSNSATAAVSFLPAGAVWRYLDTGADQGAGWRANSFNDAGWKTGSAQLGYGTGHEVTLVNYGPNPNNKYITTYFRRAIFVPDASLVQTLSARLLRADGVVVYFNGLEVWRDNLPAGAIAYGTPATTDIPAVTQTNFITKALSPSSLIDGTNIIAVEIHQGSSAGADIAFDFELTGAAIVPSQAALGFSASGGTAVLRWPQEAGLLQLYTTTDLAAPIAWTLVTNIPALSNNQWVLPIPAATNRSQFFRLQTR